MYLFPRFQAEYADIMSDLSYIAAQTTWWRETRNIEAHIDVDQLYVSRHEPVNESKVVMEAHLLITLFTRFNRLMSQINLACIKFYDKKEA